MEEAVVWDDGRARGTTTLLTRITHGSGTDQAEAWAEFISGPPDAGELFLLTVGAERYATLAADMFFERGLPGRELAYFLTRMGHAPEPLRERLWAAFADSRHDTDDLIRVMKYAPHPYRERAAELLGARFPDKRELLVGMVRLAQSSARDRCENEGVDQ